MELGQVDFKRALEELRPQFGNYRWALAILGRQYRKHATGGFPYRVYPMLKRFFNLKKPYFIGQTGNGIRFVGDIRDDYSILSAIDPQLDRLITEFMDRRVRPLEGSYLDVGANMGVVAATVASLQPQREVVAFEPVAETAHRAAATFALNGLQNVRLFQAAVGNEEGELTFFAAPDCTANASLYALDESIAWSRRQVPCYTLDGLIARKVLGKVAFIKMDVEGHEPQTIRGACKLIADQKPVLFFEYAPHIAKRVGWTLDDVIASIGALGSYRCQVLRYDNTLTELPAPTDYYSNIYCQVSTEGTQE
jgi:FkbM family methyltransferase